MDSKDTLAIILNPATPLTLAEGSSANYTVRLNQSPSGPVTLTVSRDSGLSDVEFSDAEEGAYGATATLSFTTSWNTAQTVYVRAGEDDDAGKDSGTITPHR